MHLFFRIFFFFPADQNEIQLLSVSSLLWHITKLLRKAFMLLSSLFLSNMFSDILSLPLAYTHTHALTRTHLQTLGMCPAAPLFQYT